MGWQGLAGSLSVSAAWLEGSADSKDEAVLAVVGYADLQERKNWQI